ncbi:hypothetical protein DMC14_001630 [Metamycoplasma phocicerebrale]|uniref:Uncharacterized protein n=1 Tax=Metamycoplasma phocicerebrale TaxID=142649 RepID=A0A3T0TU45_9BACT|nr:hypothetical protein [Metamycoplasma phocicerebrale]AZZ65486.1 hypothetical protein DMC14_001630 [Metamycoplasma phocicerebrale]
MEKNKKSNNKELKTELKNIRKKSINELEFLIELSKKYNLKNIDNLKIFLENKKRGHHYASGELKKIINKMSKFEDLNSIKKKNINIEDKFKKIIEDDWKD